MKRFLLPAVVLGVAVAATLAFRPVASSGQSPAVPPCCTEGVCKDKTCCEAAKKTKDDAALVAELVTILDETKSPDAFLAALLALGRFEDKSPLPVVVRNAERLGLLKGLSKDDNPSHAQELIGAYLSGELVEAFRPTNRQNFVAPAVAYPVCPQATQASPYYSQPYPPPAASAYTPATPSVPAISVTPAAAPEEKSAVPSVDAPAKEPKKKKTVEGFRVIAN